MNVRFKYLYWSVFVVTSHVECTAEERAAAGIPEGLVRYSTGIEDVEDLIADLEQALATIKNKSG